MPVGRRLRGDRQPHAVLHSTRRVRHVHSKRGSCDALRSRAATPPTTCIAESGHRIASRSDLPAPWANAATYQRATGDCRVTRRRPVDGNRPQLLVRAQRGCLSRLLLPVIIPRVARRQTSPSGTKTTRHADHVVPTIVSRWLCDRPQRTRPSPLRPSGAPGSGCHGGAARGVPFLPQVDGAGVAVLR